MQPTIAGFLGDSFREHEGAHWERRCCAARWARRCGLSFGQSRDEASRERLAEIYERSIVELSEAHGPYQTMPTAIFLSVDDADAVYDRAVRAGAVSTQAPAERPYGRVGFVKDPFGTTWYIAAPNKSNTAQTT